VLVASGLAFKQRLQQRARLRGILTRHLLTSDDHALTLNMGFTLFDGSLSPGKPLALFCHIHCRTPVYCNSHVQRSDHDVSGLWLMVRYAQGDQAVPSASELRSGSDSQPRARRGAALPPAPRRRIRVDGLIDI
jgi:hypothetical protein